MSDDLPNYVSNLGSAGGAAAVVAGIMRWFHSRDQREQEAKRAADQQRVETTLALLVQKVDGISESSRKHDQLGERLALAELRVVASHTRQDELTARLDRLIETVNQISQQLNALNQGNILIQQTSKRRR